MKGKSDRTFFLQGGLSIAVPGEIKGFHAAWMKFGKLDWEELFKPTIALCHRGYAINKHVSSSIKKRESMIRADGLLGYIYNFI